MVSVAVRVVRVDFVVSFGVRRGDGRRAARNLRDFDCARGCGCGLVRRNAAGECKRVSDAVVRFAVGERDLVAFFVRKSRRINRNGDIAVFRFADGDAFRLELVFDGFGRVARVSKPRLQAGDCEGRFARRRLVADGVRAVLAGFVDGVARGVAACREGVRAGGVLERAVLVLRGDGLRRGARVECKLIVASEIEIFVPSFKDSCRIGAYSVTLPATLTVPSALYVGSVTLMFVSSLEAVVVLKLLIVMT